MPDERANSVRDRPVCTVVCSVCSGRQTVLFGAADDQLCPVDTAPLASPARAPRMDAPAATSRPAWRLCAARLGRADAARHSSVPTPLYATYQAKWGFSRLTVTVIFGVYAVAVLVSLLDLRRPLGPRRPPAAADRRARRAGDVMLVFAFAGDLDVLLLARVLQGLATGAAVGAIGAGLVDLNPEPAAGRERLRADGGHGDRLAPVGAVRAVAPCPDRAGLPRPLAVFLHQAAGVARSRRPRPEAGARVARWPEARAPSAGPRGTRDRGAVARGRLGPRRLLRSLGPSLTSAVSGEHSMILGGASLFLLAGSASATILSFHRIEARRFRCTAQSRWSSARDRPAGRGRATLPIFGSASSQPAPASGQASKAACGRSWPCRTPPARRGAVGGLHDLLSLAGPTGDSGGSAGGVTRASRRPRRSLEQAVIVLAAITAAALARTLLREARSNERAICATAA